MHAIKMALISLAAAALWAFLPVEAYAVDGPHGTFNGCKGCHTPHGALSGTLVLWGRAFSTKTTSWSDATQTSGGTTLPKNLNGWTGTTRYCLSCHDGTETTKPWSAGAVTAGNVDMKNNHAVAVPYPSGGKANTYNAITTYGLANGTAVTGYVASPTGVKTYADPVAAAPNNRGIECGSCHDPHSLSAVAWGKYLRVDYSTGQICASCHIK